MPTINATITGAAIDRGGKPTRSTAEHITLIITGACAGTVLNTTNPGDVARPSSGGGTATPASIVGTAVNITVTGGVITAIALA